MHAGLLNDFHYPVCGCDACDSSWQAEADDLERQVLAVAAGLYREIIEWRELDPWVGYSFTYTDGAKLRRIPRARHVARAFQRRRVDPPYGPRRMVRVAEGGFSTVISTA